MFHNRDTYPIHHVPLRTAAHPKAASISKLMRFHRFRYKKAVSGRLLVKPGTPEQLQYGTRNTGTLKILNLLRFEKKNTGGCGVIAGIIIA